MWGQSWFPSRSWKCPPGTSSSSCMLWRRWWLRQSRWSESWGWPWSWWWRRRRAARSFLPISLQQLKQMNSKPRQGEGAWGRKPWWRENGAPGDFCSLLYGQRCSNGRIQLNFLFFLSIWRMTVTNFISSKKVVQYTDLWHLRQIWKLKIWICDNFCYPTTI